MTDQTKAADAKELDRLMSAFARAMHFDSSKITEARTAIHAYADRLRCESAASGEPIDMVLHCPKCGVQHIDAYEYNSDRVDRYPSADGSDDPAVSWNNPPHRSHLCHGCGHIWRPADVPTNGVAAVKTTGKNDSPTAAPAAPAEPTPAALPLTIKWPVMPPSKGQSHVLFEDGYAEGWAKCISACQAAFAALPVGVSDEPTPSAQGPDHIWLQLHGDCDESELSELVDYTGGDVTWCWHAINEHDVKYVRADLAATPEIAAPTDDALMRQALEAIKAFPGRHGSDDEMLLFVQSCTALIPALRSRLASPPQPLVPLTEEQIKPQKFYSSNEENYYELDDLVDMEGDEWEPGHVIYEGEQVERQASDYFDIEWLIEQLSERAFDEADEHAEGWPDISKDKAKELDALIGAWLDANVKVNFWTIKNVKRIELTAELIAEYTGRGIGAATGETK